ncbi:hypothetical protein JCM33374_g1533 [Metschnikowia sp. JCM 33374]|nr:hypothetical protein JCM33374_g1533 [Metschnikowia sp. JCM 33374]
MLKSRLISTNTFVRYASQEGKKRYMRTVPVSNKRSPAADFGRLNHQIPADLPKPEITGRSWAKHSLGFPLMAQAQKQAQTSTPSQRQSPQSLASSRWAKHSLDSSPSKPENSSGTAAGSQSPDGEITLLAPVRRSRTSRFKSARNTTETKASPSASVPASDTSATHVTQENLAQPAELPKVIIEPTSTETTKPAAQAETTAANTSAVKAKKPRRQLRPRKALITLTPNALENLRGLLDQPEPQLIRIGVKNRGCSGLTYHLEYVSEPGKFDEIVEQDGVRVVIDSKALFSIVGSEMDWVDDKLSSRFIFRNPNSKGTCGCGESFMV